MRRADATQKTTPSDAHAQTYGHDSPPYAVTATATHILHSTPKDQPVTTPHAVNGPSADTKLQMSQNPCQRQTAVPATHAIESAMQPADAHTAARCSIISNAEPSNQVEDAGNSCGGGDDAMEERSLSAAAAGKRESASHATQRTNTIDAHSFGEGEADGRDVGRIAGVNYSTDEALTKTTTGHGHSNRRAVNSSSTVTQRNTHTPMHGDAGERPDQQRVLGGLALAEDRSNVPVYDTTNSRRVTATHTATNHYALWSGAEAQDERCATAEGHVSSGSMSEGPTDGVGRDVFVGQTAVHSGEELQTDAQVAGSGCGEVRTQQHTGVDVAMASSAHRRVPVGRAGKVEIIASGDGSGHEHTFQHTDAYVRTPRHAHACAVDEGPIKANCKRLRVQPITGAAVVQSLHRALRKVSCASSHGTGCVRTCVRAGAGACASACIYTCSCTHTADVTDQQDQTARRETALEMTLRDAVAQLTQCAALFNAQCGGTPTHRHICPRAYHGPPHATHTQATNNTHSDSRSHPHAHATHLRSLCGDTDNAQRDHRSLTGVSSHTSVRVLQELMHSLLDVACAADPFARRDAQGSEHAHDHGAGPQQMRADGGVHAQEQPPYEAVAWDDDTCARAQCTGASARESAQYSADEHVCAWPSKWAVADALKEYFGSMHEAMRSVSAGVGWKRAAMLRAMSSRGQAARTGADGQHTTCVPSHHTHPTATPPVTIATSPLKVLLEVLVGHPCVTASDGATPAHLTEATPFEVHLTSQVLNSRNQPSSTHPHPHPHPRAPSQSSVSSTIGCSHTDPITPAVDETAHTAMHNHIITRNSHSNEPSRVTEHHKPPHYAPTQTNTNTSKIKTPNQNTSTSSHSTSQAKVSIPSTVKTERTDLNAPVTARSQPQQRTPTAAQRRAKARRWHRRKHTNIAKLILWVWVHTCGPLDLESGQLWPCTHASGKDTAARAPGQHSASGVSGNDSTVDSVRRVGGVKAATQRGSINSTGNASAVDMASELGGGRGLEKGQCVWSVSVDSSVHVLEAHLMASWTGANAEVPACEAEAAQLLATREKVCARAVWFIVCVRHI
ncbi:hypothetical protein SARC_09599 [Sphaeroforma arctica JP610]|uniref:Uncharacterized protein n=1 Tax=Sphaeroforma arctica JP610 TaxID=667725 RepID=A0A0L0FN89_9EUKA|nr:hypothetical protein SARC_09599 [Sphaeroforma arctica JP610]KNC77956.1 hypothetical protein SARC_09599 [Sphaeroforma arctica JP610]|eukprot:XP_014151858.1 hypothetical protein SARC_09599 [Sphaeroforma arctica JP610]